MGISTAPFSVCSLVGLVTCFDLIVKVLAAASYSVDIVSSGVPAWLYLHGPHHRHTHTNVRIMLEHEKERFQMTKLIA